jgi:hypothetical protein
MSRHEELTYSKMKAEDARQTARLRAVEKELARKEDRKPRHIPELATEPIGTVFFFPTKADMNEARQLVGKLHPRYDADDVVLLRRVILREAMPLVALDAARAVMRRIEADARNDAADRAYVKADTRRLDKS